MCIVSISSRRLSLSPQCGTLQYSENKLVGWHLFCDYVKEVFAIDINCIRWGFCSDVWIGCQYLQCFVIISVFFSSFSAYRIQIVCFFVVSHGNSNTFQLYFMMKQFLNAAFIDAAIRILFSLVIDFQASSYIFLCVWSENPTIRKWFPMIKLIHSIAVCVHLQTNENRIWEIFIGPIFLHSMHKEKIDFHKAKNQRWHQ